MKDLITALQILAKYVTGNAEWHPTLCNHAQLTVCVDPAAVSKEDIAALDALGFLAIFGDGCFISHRFGHC